MSPISGVLDPHKGVANVKVAHFSFQAYHGVAAALIVWSKTLRRFHVALAYDPASQWLAL